MKLAWPLLLCAIPLACVDRRSGGNEEAIGDDGSSEGSSSEDSGTASSSDSDSSSSSEAEADVETGPFPDLPSELPADCEPVFIGEPKPSVELTNIWSGWLVCNETWFRIEPVDCPYAAPFEPCEQCGDGCSDGDQCLNLWGDCGCSRNCNTDSDCAADEICLCRGGSSGGAFEHRNQCIAIGCTGEADCPSIPDDGLPHCRLDNYPCKIPDQLRCRTPNDECTFETECRCNWGLLEEHWICDQDNRICD